jgi:hypothetical protein
VERKVATGDSAGHGPDPGSEEWQSTVEFKLGIQGTDTPPRNTDAWCVYIQNLLKLREHIPEQSAEQSQT